MWEVPSKAPSPPSPGRAELVHLALWLFWTITPLWLPPEGVLINLAFATAFNLPCLWVQRYNRLRLQRLLGKG